MRNSFFILFFTAVLTLATGCSEEPDVDTSKPLIIATTGMIGDALTEMAGDRAQVITLMGPGVDPHLYKVTRSDIELMSKADAIVYNGLHLEGKMSEVLERLAAKQTVIAVGDGISESDLVYYGAGEDRVPDPHIWFSVNMFKQGLEYAANRVNNAIASTPLQPAQYLQKLDALNQWITQQIATIPENQRVLITAHDAFEYFGKQYNVEVRGLLGVSTLADFGLKDRRDMVNFIVSRNIKAVFPETAISDRFLQAVIEDCKVQGHSIEFGNKLYADALGDPNTPEGTYIGAVRFNVESIVEALGKTQP